MTTLKWKIIALFLLGTGVLTTVNAGETDSVLAAVNGDPITLGEVLPMVREREFQLRSAYSGKALERQIALLRSKAVEELIDRKLIVADFQKQNFTIPSHEVENELDRWSRYIGCHSRKELEERARKSGTSITRLKEKMLHRMIVQVMRRREFLLVGSPSPADLFKRFKKEQKALSFPGSVELALLKLPAGEKALAAQIASELKKDPSRWSLKAASYAITPGTDGNIGAIELDKLRPEFARALKDIKKHRIYNSIQIGDGIYFLKIVKYTPPRPARFKEHAEALRKKMENEIYQKSNAGYAARLRDAAVIEYFFPVPEGVEKK